MNRKELLRRATQWKKVLELLKDDAVGLPDILERHPWLSEEGVTASVPRQDPSPKGKNDDPLNPAILDMLKKETNIDSKDAWWNIWWLVSKPEHDNEDRAKAFESNDKGVSVFSYASALSYDWKDRGVTMGLVGFTTAYDGKDAQGDAMDLFKIYKSLGGEDLAPMAVGCTKNKDKCTALIKKIQSVGDDPKWIEAQWRALFTPSGYLKKTIETWRKIGVENPSALAIAAVLDTSLNQGWDGRDGGCIHLEKLAVRGDENKTLEKYLEWKAKAAAGNDYNSPPINGKNRANQFEQLRKAQVYSLVGDEATKAIQKAISWTMK